MTRVRFALAALPLLAIAGCDGDGGSIPIGDLGARLASASCDVGVRCGTTPDRASCLASTFVDLGQYEADVEAGRLKYDGSAAARCIAAFESTTGNGGCSVTTSLSAQQPKACKSIFTGAVSIGGACFADFECQSGSCDTSACSGASCCAGSCVASTTPPPAAIGMTCSALVSGACVDGAFCQMDASGGSNGTCVAQLGAGEACSSLVGQCATGTVCVPGAGTCGKLPGDGAPCSGSAPCDVAEDYCEPTTGLCVQRVGLRGACPVGNECVPYAACDLVTHTCIPYGQSGDPCSDTAPCLGSLQCSTTTAVCTAPAPQAVCP